MWSVCPLLSPSLPTCMLGCEPGHHDCPAWSPQMTSLYAGCAPQLHTAQVSCVALVPAQQCSSTPVLAVKTQEPALCNTGPCAAQQQCLKDTVQFATMPCRGSPAWSHTATMYFTGHLSPRHNTAKEGSPKGCSLTPDSAGWHLPTHDATVQVSPAQSRSSTPGLASPARGADSGAPPRYRPTSERSRAASPGSGASSIASSAGVPAASNTRQPTEVCGKGTPAWSLKGTPAWDDTSTE